MKCGNGKPKKSKYTRFKLGHSTMHYQPDLLLFSCSHDNIYKWESLIRMSEFLTFRWDFLNRFKWYHEKFCCFHENFLLVWYYIVVIVHNTRFYILECGHEVQHRGFVAPKIAFGNIVKTQMTVSPMFILIT